MEESGKIFQTKRMKKTEIRVDDEISLCLSGGKRERKEKSTKRFLRSRRGEHFQINTTRLKKPGVAGPDNSHRIADASLYLCVPPRRVIRPRQLKNFGENLANCR